jgi:two-component system CitB family sensor kinase
MDAAAAAPPPHRVSVAATAQDGVLVLTVVDSGAGLPAGDVERAFTRGWSTKTSGRLIGRGLGLALVGQAVHRCGGTIEVAGGAGALSGAAFTVRLPLLPDRVAAR